MQIKIDDSKFIKRIQRSIDDTIGLILEDDIDLYGLVYNALEERMKEYLQTDEGKEQIMLILLKKKDSILKEIEENFDIERLIRRLKHNA